RTCSGCVPPSYAFASSDPTIGDFVQPSAAGSRFPKLNSSGKPIASSQSGLFCGYNTGTTTITVTAGLLSASLPVTVRAGGFGRPCGTVSRRGVGRVLARPRTAQVPQQASPPPSAPPAAPAAAPVASTPLPLIQLPPPPAPAPKPAAPVPPAE